jgi:hypothetical protein
MAEFHNCAGLDAARIYEQMMTDLEFAEFLTPVAYEYID